MTLESSPLSLMQFSLMLVELVYSDPDGGVPYSGQFHAIEKKSNDDEGSISHHMWGHTSGKKSLSHLADSFVRRFPMTTWTGREWKYPYKKRLNGTLKAISDDFINKFVDIMDHVIEKEPDMKLVFQMGFGGGASRAKGHDNVGGVTITSIPNRNIVYQFVFDLFYRDHAVEKAVALQAKMQSIVEDDFSNGQEKRFFWGSFEDTNMSNEKIRNMYYDSEKQYSDLQNLKKRIDPNDVFHTNFTVQLPKAD